jgi:Ras-related protein Rab-32
VYYREAVAAFVVFDVTRVSTFEAVTKWKSDIDAKVFLPDNRPIPVVLLANKCDLAGKEGICQDKHQMDKFCEENGFIGWWVFLF